MSKYKQILKNEQNYLNQQKEKCARAINDGDFVNSEIIRARIKNSEIIVEALDKADKLEAENAELKALTQGLTPEMIRRFKLAIEQEDLCTICSMANKEDCEGEMCHGNANFDFYKEVQNG
jgi:hypothetical protein